MVTDNETEAVEKIQNGKARKRRDDFSGLILTPNFNNTGTVGSELEHARAHLAKDPPKPEPPAAPPEKPAYVPTGIGVQTEIRLLLEYYYPINFSAQLCRSHLDATYPKRENITWNGALTSLYHTKQIERVGHGIYRALPLSKRRYSTKAKTMMAAAPLAPPIQPDPEPTPEPVPVRIEMPPSLLNEAQQALAAFARCVENLEKREQAIGLREQLLEQLKRSLADV